MVLHTHRLILREYQHGDYAALRHIHGNKEVQALRGQDVLTEQETRDEIHYVLAAQQEHPRLRYQWIIEDNGDCLSIGYCRLQRTSSQAAEIGYFLHPAAWGKGYAVETASAMLTFAFGQLKLHRIVAGCIASITTLSQLRCAERYW